MKFSHRKRQSGRSPILSLGLAAAGLLALTPLAHAQTFSPTGSMAIARGNHQATLLQDGRVLVSGGGDTSNASIAAAEIFDPITGTWSVTGSNLTPRQEHAAVRLNDGRVLVVGGVHHYFACSSNASAETYDPSTGAWSPTGNLPSTVGTATIAVRLSDGRVLVAGGGNRCGGVFASAALFDPATNTWSPTNSMSIPREFHSAELLHDGRVLVAGGASSSPFLAQQSAEIFDPLTGTWTPTGAMITGRATACGAYVHSYLAPLLNGRVFAAGAWRGSCSFGLFPNSSAESFDPVIQSWSAVAPMASPRGSTTITLLNSGNILVAGGNNLTSTLASAEEYDPSTNSWTTVGSLNAPREGHSATRLLDGRVLIAGGAGSVLFATAELYGAQTPDTTPPQVSCGTADGNWHGSDASIACTATDSGSGLADPSDAAFSLSTSVPAGVETANATTVSRIVCDVAGNCVTAGPIGGNKVDKAAPAIAIVSPAASTYTLGQAVAADYSCQDGGAGISTCAGPVASGGSVDTATAGSKVFVVNGTDAVGHASNSSVSYSVAYGVCLLYDPLKSHRAGSTLPVKLQLCEASGANRSQSNVVLTATGVFLVSPNAPGVLEDSGNANPDAQFRYDSGLGGGGYIFNLSLKGFTTGTYALRFIVTGDSTPHEVTFQVK